MIDTRACLLAQRPTGDTRPTVRYLGNGNLDSTSKTAGQEVPEHCSRCEVVGSPRRAELCQDGGPDECCVGRDERPRLPRRLGAQFRIARDGGADGCPPQKPHRRRNAGLATLSARAGVRGLAMKELHRLCHIRARRSATAASQSRHSHLRRRRGGGGAGCAISTPMMAWSAGAPRHVPQARASRPSLEKKSSKMAGACDTESSPTGRHMSGKLPSRDPWASSE